MLNNPIRYSDPSGHSDSGECGPGEDCEEKSRLRNWEEYKEKQKKNQGNNIGEPEVSSTDILINIIDKILWTTTPSAFGVQIGGSGQIGGCLEGGVNTERDLIFNWRSGEISLYKTTGPQLYAGTPNFIAANTYIGTTKVYGMSRNSNFEGGAIYNGFTVSAERIEDLSYTHEIGIAIEPSIKAIPDPYIDKISNHAIYYEQTNISLVPLSISAAP